MDFRPEKKLGFGLMRMPQLNPADAASVDLDQVCRMVDLFLERGFTYFDTAWMYNGFASETVAGKALVARHPRESFTLATKLHCGFFNSREDMEKIFSTQLANTGAGYFDYYLLHAIQVDNYHKYDEYGIWDFVKEQKEKGLIRHWGFSFHASHKLLVFFFHHIIN